MKYLCLILIILSTTFLFAQQESEEEGAVDTAPKTSVFDLDAKQFERSKDQIIPQQQFLEQVFEKEIDPETYILGPGDQLLIKVWGVLEAQYVSYVSPEGFVVIPTVSEIHVSGRPLAEGAQLIKDALAKSFKNAQFSTRLVRMRKFRVFVVGEVGLPGTYFLRAVDRVSDAISLARDLTDWGDETRIQVRRESGVVDTIDISEFNLRGNLAQNPLLEGGDVVYVPRIDLQGEFVIIEGNVGSQGIYQTRMNETLFNFLTRLKALNRRSDVENVVLLRGDSLKVFNLLEGNSGARSEVLRTGDRIRIPSHRNQVYVRGEVFQPGPYPFLANYNTQDYAGSAGLLETSKSLEHLYVIRAETGEIEVGNNVIVENGDVVVVPRKKRETWKDILTIITPIISIALSTWAIIRTTSN